MRARIRHRGPDQGSTDALGACVLGHQRLQVIDPELGYQPVANETGDVTAVFNGELYNFAELRDDLASRGHEVRGRGDTPVIPHLYEEYGTRFVEHLEGMFAIALWDAPRRRLVLARDRLGKKPLVWTQPAGRHLRVRVRAESAACAAGAAAASPTSRRSTPTSHCSTCPALARGSWASTGSSPARCSSLEGDGAPATERYWSPRADRRGVASDDEWLDRVRDEVTAAVRERLVSDVPLGALLSGGIDSAIVVALMAQASAEPMRTFTVGFGDERYDERRYARAVAERWSTRHEEIVLEPDAAATLLASPPRSTSRSATRPRCRSSSSARPPAAR